MFPYIPENMSISVSKIDEAFVSINCEDRGIHMEISDHYCFFVPGYRFIPSYRNKLWNGKIYLYNQKSHLLPYGLVNNLKKFTEDRNYKCNFEDGILPTSINDTILAEFIRKLSIPFDIRDYQLTAWHHAINAKRAVLVSPTGSGKSLIIYMLMRYYFDNFSKKILIIVPTTSLVEQLYKDFEDYSQKNGFSASDHVHRIYSGRERNDFPQRVAITTWQSAIMCKREWFQQFGMVIGDEAHTFKAKSLNSIMEKLTKAEYRIGTTGTLDGSLVHELVLTGHFGDTFDATTTKELIDNGTLAKLEIKCLVMKHPEEVRKNFKKKKYQEEIAFLVENEDRNNFIKNLTLDQKGNTLVLYNLVKKHGEPLFKEIQANAEDGRQVYFVSGKVSADQRERIRELTEEQTNAIIVASYGVFSTGINIRNLNNIVFTSPTKSQIRVLQSIGRGLRKGDDDTPTTVFDISDNLSWKKRVNYTMKHGIERVKLYEKQGFDYKFYEIPL